MNLYFFSPRLVEFVQNLMAYKINSYLISVFQSKFEKNFRIDWTSLSLIGSDTKKFTRGSCLNVRWISFFSVLVRKLWHSTQKTLAHFWGKLRTFFSEYRNWGIKKRQLIPFPAYAHGSWQENWCSSSSRTLKIGKKFQNFEKGYVQFGFWLKKPLGFRKNFNIFS